MLANKEFECEGQGDKADEMDGDSILATPQVIVNKKRSNEDEVIHLIIIFECSNFIHYFFRISHANN